MTARAKALSAVRSTAGRAGAAARWGKAREKTHQVRVFDSDAAWLLSLAPTSAQAVRKAARGRARVRARMRRK